jgi:hypothetical protein
MSFKVTIGAYVIDGARSGSASTTTGVRLGFPEGQGTELKWREGKTSAVLAFAVYLDGITGAANVKTAVDAVRSAIINTGNADVVISFDGTTQRQFLVSTGEFSRITGTVDAEEQENSAFLICELTCERVGVASGTAGDNTGAIDALEWNYAEGAQGLAKATVSGVFKTKATAISFVQFFRNSSNWPAWIPSSYWVMLPTPVYEFEQQLNQSSPVPESAFTPCRATVMFQQIPAEVASVMKSQSCLNLTYRIRKEPAPPQDENSGEDPGNTFSIEAVAQFQVDNNSSFDSGDTANVTVATLETKALAILTALKTAAQATMADSLEIVDKPIIERMGDAGQVLISATYLSATKKILLWEETVELHFAFQGGIYTLDDGAEGISGHKAGDSIECSHTLNIDSLEPINYRRPTFMDDSSWQPIGRSPQVPRVKRSQQGTRRYEARWVMNYHYMNPGTPSENDVAASAGVTI